MYQGRVAKAFVDRFNPGRGAYRPGETFASDKLERMQDLADAGYIEFDAAEQARGEAQSKGKKANRGGKKEPAAEE